MAFPLFSKKEDRNPNQNGQDKKNNRSLEALEGELNVLDRFDMGKLGGGKDTKKPFSDFSDLRDTPGGTIPL